MNDNQQDVEIRLRVIDDDIVRMKSAQDAVKRFGDQSAASFGRVAAASKAADRDMGQSLNRSKSMFKDVAQSVTGMTFGIAGAVAGLVYAVKSASDANVSLGASFQNMSNRTDMSVESLVKWKFITEQNGSSLDEFEQATRKLQNTMADAATGNSTAIDTFARLGVSATDVNGNMRDVETVLLEVGQAVRQYGAASIQGAAAQDALGRSSAGVVAIIKQMPDALRAQMAEASAYTSHMTTAWAKSADAADDAAARAKATAENIRAAHALDPSFFTKMRANFMLMFDTGTWAEVHKAQAAAAKAEGVAAAVAFQEAFANQLTSPLPKTGASEPMINGAIFELAAKFKVAVSEKKWAPESGTFIDVPRTADVIAADVLKAQQEGVKKAAEARTAAAISAQAMKLGIKIKEISVSATGARIMMDRSPQELAADLKKYYEEAFKLYQQGSDSATGATGKGQKKTGSLAFGMSQDEMRDVQRRFKESASASENWSTTLREGAVAAGDAIRNSLINALGDSKAKLIDLGMIAKSVFATLLGGAINIGLGALMPSLKPMLGLKALGGPTPAYGARIVGEYGPEIIIPDRPSRVIPSDRTAALMGGGGGSMHIDARTSVNLPASSVIFLDSPASLRRLADQITRVKEQKISRTYRSRANG